MNITDNFSLILILVSIISPFGIPLGATFFIISAGSLSATPTEYVFFVALVFIGFIIGDIASYFVASYFERFLTEKFCNYGWYTKKCETARSFFNEYGVLSVFLSRFLLTAFGAPVNYLAGFNKFSFRKFFIAAASGEFLYAAIYTYIGFAFKDSWIYLYDTTADLSFTIILILLAVFTFYQLKKYLLNDRKKFNMNLLFSFPDQKM